MLIITMEGGLISSISTDDNRLREQLNIDRVVVVDYDTEGLEEDRVTKIHILPDGRNEAEVHNAYAYVEDVRQTVIDTQALADACDRM